jgi:hypothetical protein
MDYTTIKECIGNDRTHIYRVTSAGEWPITLLETYNLQPNSIYYFPPQLCYGDYIASCEIERSNVRVFQKEFKEVPGWKLKTWEHDSKAIYIDLTCDHQGIIQRLIALKDYPIMDEEDCSAILVEMETEGWDKYLRREFITALEKHFSANHSDPEEAALNQFYYQLKECTNTETIVSGGAIYVNMNRLVHHLDTPPDYLHLEWW